MASASKYTWTRSDGSTSPVHWRARWTDAQGTRRDRRGFTRRGDAMAYAEDREAEVRHGLDLDGATPTRRVTVEQWSATWLERQHVRPNTMLHYKAVARRVSADLGSRPLTALRPAELASWRASMEPRYADSTIAATWGVFRMMLAAAVEEGVIRVVPMPSSRGARRKPVVDAYELLTLDQVRAWSEAMPLVGREMPLVAAMTGLRQGELLGLRPHNVDFLRREMRVVEQLQTFRGGGPEFTPPKTASGIRSIPLPILAVEALARHLARYPAVDGEPIFRTEQGRRWRRNSFGDVWRGAKVKAGLPKWAHWHALRDVYASSLIRGGMDPHALVSLMGHSSLDQAGPYLKVWADGLDRARRAMDDLWSGGQTRGSDDNAAGRGH